METLTFELSTPIKYSPGTGAEIDGTHIEVSPPNGKIAHLIGTLKAEIMQATKTSLDGIDLSSLEGKQVEKDNGDEDDEYGEFAFTALTMGGADMKKVFVTFKEIMKSSALMGGEKPFTEPMWNRMDYPDVERCLKEYIGNFMKA